MEQLKIQRLQRALMDGWPITWGYDLDYHGQSPKWETHWLSYANGKYQYKADSNRGPDYQHDLEYTAEALLARLQIDESFARECESAYQRARNQKIDDAISALEGGARFYEGGEESRGSEVVGGEVTLYKEGDLFLYQSVDWHSYGAGSAAPRETKEQKLSKSALRTKLLEDDPALDFCLRALQSL